MSAVESPPSLIFFFFFFFDFDFDFDFDFLLVGFVLTPYFPFNRIMQGGRLDDVPHNEGADTIVEAKKENGQKVHYSFFSNTLLPPIQN